MLVTFREHAAPNLCIFHIGVTIGAGRRGIVDFSAFGAISDLFASWYGYCASLWYLKC
jgi:hypothetical protein